MNIVQKIAEELEVKEYQVQNTIDLMDDGNTVPFIARYRKEATGGLTDVELRALEERYGYLTNLEERKEEVIRLIEEQGKLTEELKKEIEKAEILQRVEDLYKPYKKKKATRASKAKEKGLEPLADLYFNQEDGREPMKMAEAFINKELGVETAEEAMAGAMDIIAERVAEDADLTEAVRLRTWEDSIIRTEATDEEEKTVYDMYYGKEEPLHKIPNHRVLAINRGEKEKKLKVKIIAPESEIISYLKSQIIENDTLPVSEILKEAITDGYKRLIASSVEREMRNRLTERASEEAIKVFAKNTEKLLMAPPLKDGRIISIDPGYRTGCKVAAINETGKLLAYATIYPTEPKNDIAGTERILTKLIEKYNINIITIGNGTASKETEEVVANFIQKNNLDVKYTIINEAGASVYSASKVAAEEYPDLDVTTRGAMSLGRRLQDPLAELVKIDPKSIGVGQYQHDMDQKILNNSLSNVVEDCVNRVGVDLNTASASLLSYVAGINAGIAKNIVSYREEVGIFKNRRELLKVSKLGEKAFKQCAGFMRITDGENPLDATAVHPESYEVASKLLEKLKIDIKSIKRGGVADIEDKITVIYPAKMEKAKSVGKGLQALAQLKEKKPKDNKLVEKSICKLAEDLGVGEMTLKDIVEEIKKPARDPRKDAPPVIFRNDIKKFDDLKVGMMLQGTVRNVVDFGAFVDVGLKNDGLVHISQLSNKFISNPHNVVAVGDNVKVKILEIDKEKEKISLSMKF